MNERQLKQENQDFNLNNEEEIEDWLVAIDTRIAREECTQGMHSPEFCILYLPA